MIDPDIRERIFIGDIHGQAATLVALLDALGWKPCNGRLQGPGGVGLVFVGDLIDRGPESRRTVETVRALVERGDAICLMGNHEYNAVQFHTPDPDHPGEYLRPHAPHKVRQHQRVLDEFANDHTGLKDMLAWFRTLPVALEGPDWRCVHACWHPDMLDRLDHRDGAWYLPDDRWVAAARKDQPEYQAIEVLTKGPEVELPGGATFADKDGHVRREARLKWWEPAPATLDEALLFQTVPEGLDLDAPFPQELVHGYPGAAPPVFFGHYWKTGPIRPERPNAACLDYSAGKGDRLVGYRMETSGPIAEARFIAQPIVAPGDEQRAQPTL